MGWIRGGSSLGTNVQSSSRSAKRIPIFKNCRGIFMRRATYEVEDEEREKKYICCSSSPFFLSFLSRSYCKTAGLSTSRILAFGLCTYTWLLGALFYARPVTILTPPHPARFGRHAGIFKKFSIFSPYSLQRLSDRHLLLFFSPTDISCAPKVLLTPLNFFSIWLLCGYERDR